MIPDFIIGLYENEIRKVVEKAIDAIVDKFGLDADLVRKTVEARIEMSLELVPEETETFKVVKKTPTKSLPDAQNRCIALLSTGCQCTIRHHSCADNRLCARHARLMEMDESLKFGTVNDPKLASRSKKKLNIY